ncbi:MAG: penicillin-binding protein 2 [Minisyncoccota bacterium]
MRLFQKKIFFMKKRGMEIDDAVLTITESDITKIEWSLRRSPMRFYWILSIILFVVLAGRVVQLNVIQGSLYRETAERNSVRSLVIPAPRGIIYDRFGTQLVYNTPSMDAVITPVDVPQDFARQETIRRLLLATFIIDEEVLNEIFQKLDYQSLQPIFLKEHVTQEELLLFLSRANDLPGVSLYHTTKRRYVDSLIFSHILGYEGKIRKEELELHQDYLLTDTIGKQGIEKSYDTALRGEHGYQQAEVDAFGRITKELGMIMPTAGSDIILNVDAELQKKLFDRLQDLLNKQELKQAVAIAIDPRNGAIRALVSLPSFDNNLFAGNIKVSEYQKLIQDPTLPLFNRAVAGEYPPGSTIKPVLATAGLAEGVINENTQIESRGGISVGNFFFGDWKVHGFTDVRRAIAVSSDVFFYSVGGGYGNITGLGMERMKRYENLFGYGSKTGIDIPGEASGFIPDPVWKRETLGERWYIGDDYHASIGQGFVTATPIQILNSIATIANGGTLYVPHLVSQVRSTDGAVTTIGEDQVRTNIVNPDILQIVREGMRATIMDSHGTAQSLKNLSVEIAGKTGTAQFGTANKTHGWFVSFAPYKNPSLAMIVLVEGQGEEGYNAVPVTKDVYEWYFSRPEIIQENSH